MGNIDRRRKLPTGKVYRELRGHKETVCYRSPFFNNKAIALLILWMHCRGTLSTRDILNKFVNGIEERCSFCTSKESNGHVFFFKG